MPAPWMTADHLVSSRSMIAACSSGVVDFGLAAFVDDALAHLLGRERRAQFLVQPLDDRPRRAGRCQEAVIQCRVETRQAGFGKRRQLRQQSGVLGGGDRERADIAAVERRARHRNGVEADLEETAHHVEVQRVRAFLRNLLDRDAGLLREQHRGQIIDRADARRADLIRLLGALHQGNQFTDGVNRQILVHQQQRRRRSDQADRGEILARIVADILVKVRAGRQGRGIAQDDRVAVRRCVGDLAGADGAAAAGIATFDDDLLAERDTHLIGDRARHDVVGAARRQRNDQRDRPVRIVVRRDRAGHSERGDRRQNRNGRRQPRQNTLPAQIVLHFFVAAPAGAGR